MATCNLCSKSSRCNAERPCTHVDNNSDLSCGICLELDKLDGDIEGFKSALENAVEQRSAYLERVNHRYDPIQRLPVELVAFIFALCLPHLPSLDVFDVSNAMQKDIVHHPVQFLFGSICRFWRRVVSSTPQLWNILWLHVSSRTTMAQHEILTEWLSHSAQLPLYVAMYYIEDGNDLRSDTPAWSSINQMIDTLCLYASRMRVLHLSLLGPHISRFGRLPTNAPAVIIKSNGILEKLSIVPISGFNDRFRLADQGLKPTHISFKDIRLGPQAIYVHWGYVTCVEAQGLQRDDVIKLLKMAPQLQQLMITVKRDNRHIAPITHHSLKILDIACFDPSLIEFLTCPVLEELTYFCHPAVETFLRQSACPLRKLNVEWFPAPTQFLVALLRLTPLLTHLALTNIGIPDQFLAYFVETAHIEQSYSETDLFLPNLRSFSCNVSFDGGSFHWSKIPSLIPQFPDAALAARPLSEITITFDQEADLEDERHAMDRESLVQTLKLVQDGGVVLKVKDSAGLDLIRWSELVHDMI